MIRLKSGIKRRKVKGKEIPLKYFKSHLKLKNVTSFVFTGTEQKMFQNVLLFPI